VGAFDTDFNVVDDMFAEAFGGTVSIHRGDASTSGITAEKTFKDYETQDLEGFITAVRFADWVITVDAYVISGSAVVPREGDQVKQAVNGTTSVYEVLPLADGQCKQYADESETRWVIHTKRVGEE